MEQHAPRRSSSDYRRIRVIRKPLFYWRGFIMQGNSYDYEPCLTGYGANTSLGVFTESVSRALRTLSVKHFDSPAEAYMAAASNSASRFIVDADNVGEALRKRGAHISKLILICAPERAATALDALDARRNGRLLKRRDTRRSSTHFEPRQRSGGLGFERRPQSRRPG